mgnify:CR=1 FL=1
MSNAIDKTPDTPAPAGLPPPVNVVEDAHGITLHADLPGVPKDKLSLQVDGDKLTIEGELSLPLPEGMASLHADLSLPRYRRVFTLSKELDTEKVAAELVPFINRAVRRAGLVEAVRGPGGGYRLARSPDAIRISEVMEAVEENVDALHTGAGASGGASGSPAQGLTNRLWEGLSAQVYVFLHQTRLSDVVTDRMVPCPAVPSLFRVVDED